MYYNIATYIINLLGFAIELNTKVSKNPIETVRDFSLVSIYEFSNKIKLKIN